jgi:rRNA maturation RNase YbeY
VGVELRCDCASARRYARAVRSDAARLLRSLRLDAAELSIVLTGDRAIQKLNRTFRRKNSPTDVLSFPLIDDGTSPLLDSPRLSPRERPLATSSRERVRVGGLLPPTPPPSSPLGDVVISIDTARRQARDLATSLPERLRTLLIHGLLHLLGYDHERSAADARRMFAKEHALASALGPSHRRPPRA